MLWIWCSDTLLFLIWKIKSSLNLYLETYLDLYSAHVHEMYTYVLFVTEPPDLASAIEVGPHNISQYVVIRLQTHIH